MSCGRGNEEEEEQAGDEMMQERTTLPGNGSTAVTCVKCRVRPVQISRLRAGYCADCFVGTVGRRFKDVMHLAREHCRAPKGSKDRCNGSILLAFSDSVSSRMVLDLLREHYCPPTDSQARTKPAFSKVEILHIQQGNQEESTIEALRQVVGSYSYELTVVPEKAIFEGSTLAVDANSSDLDICVASTSTLPAHQSTSLSATSRQTLAYSTLSAYITQYAVQKGHKAILFCENATKLAAKTLTAMAKGQGYIIGEMVSSADVPVVGTDVRIYRPLANISGQEVRFYGSAQVKNWPSSSLPHVSLQTRQVDKAGIDGLVESFVQNLELGFPSTVSVISRTAAKLGLRSKETHIAGPLCPMCGLPSDPNAKAWREMASLSSLSQVVADKTTSNAPILHENSGNQVTLADKLCYGCLVPFLELQGKAQRGTGAIHLALPTYSQDLIDASKATRRAEMRAEIADFLL